MLRKRKYGRTKGQRIGDAVVSAAAVLTIIFLSVIIIKYLTAQNPAIKIENVQAMRAPYETVAQLHELSVKHKKDFAELLSVYMLDNNFFDTKTALPSNDELMEKYIKKYGRLKSRYGKKKFEPYKNIIKTMLREVKYFPVLENDGLNRGYFYGDNFGLMRTDGVHYAIDIVDRENISGRLDVFSMTDGVITEIGISKEDGYHIGVTTEAGNYYYYAHLHGIEMSLKKNDEVKAGKLLGTMGNSGTSEAETGYAVRLHISVLVKSPLADGNEDSFYVNPYIFLKFVEK